MGIPTLIKTLTASNSATLSFVDGASDVTLDSTYDEYMFVFTDYNHDTVGGKLRFTTTKTTNEGFEHYNNVTTIFRADHDEDDDSDLSYDAGEDVADATTHHTLTPSSCTSDADASVCGIIHLFNPSSTTFLTHWYGRFSYMKSNGPTNEGASDAFSAGYVNSADYVSAVNFENISGTADAVIQLYGIA